ncbi:hemolysin III family protein [Adlercreutzia sp. R25]|uniref:Hemolysin III family protein n=1 Tax=Adlercreutzia shanghongiae TaxID=3111773 RepID=A0ABU6IY67_9ACTN|nr:MULTISPECIES: hemolysin III family protein [unclassified Adlercreutzia]MEC4271788.1 hemolysin III family protein [Adlercreutzia sp. R25]MEC4294795.1 hemolysin III family protein [Adlercreutzia sp. R22]
MPNVALAHPELSPNAAAAAAKVSPEIRELLRRHGKKSVREYTLGEEIFNAVTHGVGAGLAVAALVLLIVKSVSDGGGILLAAALVYGIAMLVEYLMSTLYHAIAAEGAKRVFKVLDHSGIYLLIAGTYTPYCLVSLGHVGGLWLATFVWGVSLLGIAFEAFWTFRPRWISAALYVALGWSIVFFLPELYAQLHLAGFWLLAAGGISYTVGAVFYIFKKVRYLHSVFHLFVLVGSILQFFSVYFFVI